MHIKGGWYGAIPFISSALFCAREKMLYREDRYHYIVSKAQTIVNQINTRLNGLIIWPNMPKELYEFTYEEIIGNLKR